MVSHPENGSDSPIGSDRDRGRDKKPGIWFLGAVWIDLLGNCCLDCGLVWLWSFKDVKNDM